MSGANETAQKQFKEALVRAGKNFQTSKDVEAKREACAEALTAVMHFLRVEDFPAEYLNTFSALFAALSNASKGSKNALMESAKKIRGGRPGRPQEFEAKWTAASASMSLFMEIDGLTEELAARQVARIFVSYGFPFPKEPTRSTPHYTSSQKGWSRDAKAIANWRNKLRKGKKGEALKKSYFQMKDDAKKNLDSDIAATFLRMVLDSKL